MVNNEGYFTSPAFSILREEGLSAVDEINEWNCVKINKIKLRETVKYFNVNPSFTIPVKYSDVYFRIFNEASKYFQNNNHQNTNEEVLTKSSYLSIIHWIITNYLKSNKLNKDEENFIKSEKDINENIFNNLVFNKIIKENEGIGKITKE